MKLRIASDIHLEFYKHNDFKLPLSDNEHDTVLVLAGDICVINSIERYRYFFNDIASRFRKVIYILGNHEFYHLNIIKTKRNLMMFLDDYPNIVYLDNDTYIFDGVAFIGSTLWTDLDNNDPILAFDAKRRMNDYKKIRHGTQSEPWLCKLHPHDTYMFHQLAVEFIKDEFKRLAKFESYEKIVVVSHHAPSTQSTPAIYKTKKLNGCYASNLDDMIYNLEPDMWIHGHTHFSFDYMIGKCRIICNPKGYICEQNKSFSNDVIDI